MMLLKNTLWLTISLLWILLSSFYPVEELLIPEKKINKTISKLWKDRQLSLQEETGNDFRLCAGNNRLFEVVEQTTVLGYVYVGRVNSCRSGGCDLDAGNAAVEFEYFDYFFVTDSLGKVLNVKVYNYRATHGHEIMSRGWLRQFAGYSAGETLVYGKDIEAISGATVSANAINNDIQLEMICLQKYMSANCQ